MADEKLLAVRLTGPLVFSTDRVLRAGEVHQFPEAEALRLVEGQAAVLEVQRVETPEGAENRKLNKR